MFIHSSVFYAFHEMVSSYIALRVDLELRLFFAILPFFVRNLNWRHSIRHHLPSLRNKLLQRKKRESLSSPVFEGRSFQFLFLGPIVPLRFRRSPVTAERSSSFQMKNLLSLLDNQRLVSTGGKE